MTALLTLLGIAMDSYDNECSGSPDTFPCTPNRDFAFIAAAALSGGFGFAILILCLEKCL